MRNLVAGLYCLSDMVGHRPMAAHIQDPFSTAGFIMREAPGIQLFQVLRECRRQTRAREFRQRTQAQRLEQLRPIILHRLGTPSQIFLVPLIRESARQSGKSSIADRISLIAFLEKPAELCLHQHPHFGQLQTRKGQMCKRGTKLTAKLFRGLAQQP